MTLDLDAALAAHPPQPESAVTVVEPTPRRHRHVWGWNLDRTWTWCLVCAVERDVVRSRRGRSSRRLGGDYERRVERLYGPRKVGEYGDPVDHLGRDFAWQAKSSRSLPPRWLAAISEPVFRPRIPAAWLAAMSHMAGYGGARRPLLVRGYVRHGVPTRDWIVLTAKDWTALHGPWGDETPPFVVMDGAAFLAIHGTDEEERR